MSSKRLRFDPLMAKLLRQALCVMDSDEHDAEESEFDELCDQFEAPSKADVIAGEPILVILEADDLYDESEELSTMVLAFGLHLSARCRPSVEFPDPPLELPLLTMDETVFEESCRFKKSDFLEMCDAIQIEVDEDGNVITDDR